MPRRSRFSSFLLLLIALASPRAHAQVSERLSRCLKLYRATQIDPKSAADFPAECVPDTLYSWMSPEQLRKLGRSPGAIPLFAWRSPLGTFAYGDVSIRLKLRSDIRFRFTASPYCERSLDPDAMKNTLLIRQNGTGLTDFLICSPALVESWSYGTEEHLRELSDEYSYIKRSGSAASCYLEGRREVFGHFRPKAFDACDTQFFSPENPPAVDPGARVTEAVETWRIDDKDWRESHLQRNLELHAAALKKGKSRFLSPSGKSRASHFETARPHFRFYRGR